MFYEFMSGFIVPKVLKGSRFRQNQALMTKPACFVPLTPASSSLAAVKSPESKPHGVGALKPHGLSRSVLRLRWVYIMASITAAMRLSSPQQTKNASEFPD